MDSVENIIRDNFESKALFTKNEFANLLHANNIAINDNALRQHIFKLTLAGVLQSPKRGLFTIKTKPVFKAVADNFLIKTRRIFTAEYPEINYCIWSSKWLHDFMVHQPFNHFYIFEIESDMMETAFNLFIDNKRKAFLLPDKNIVEKYISRSENPVIVGKLSVRSPIEKNQNSNFPTLEKMLVDVFSNRTLFYYYLGNEMKNIFLNSTDNYFINYSALFSYAAIRGKKHEIKAFLENNININPILLQ